MAGILARIVPACCGFTLAQVTEGGRDLIIAMLAAMACLVSGWVLGAGE